MPGLQNSVMLSRFSDRQLGSWASVVSEFLPFFPALHFKLFRAVPMRAVHHPVEAVLVRGLIGHTMQINYCIRHPA